MTDAFDPPVRLDQALVALGLADSRARRGGDAPGDDVALHDAQRVQLRFDIFLGHLAFQGRYTGYRYTNAQNTDFLPSSFILDMSAGISLPHGWEIRMTVKNLADASYIDLEDYPVPGRWIQISVHYRGGRQWEE